MHQAWIPSWWNASSAARAAWRGATAFKHFESPECPECGYLGWAPVLEVTDAENERRAAGERELAEQQLPSVA